MIVIFSGVLVTGGTGCHPAFPKCHTPKSNLLHTNIVILVIALSSSHKDHEATCIHCYFKRSVLCIGGGLGLRLGNISHKWGCYILHDYVRDVCLAAD